LISLVLFDTSQNAGFSARVAGWVSGCDFPDVRHVRQSVGPPRLADEPRVDRPDNVAHVRSACAKIYNWMRAHVTTNYVVILEDDIFPQQADVIERLLHGFDQEVDSVAAAYPSRYTPHVVAWTNENNGRRPIPFSDRGEGLATIGGNGFGCVILRTAALRGVVFSDTPPPGTGLSHDFDIAFYQQQQRRQVRLDWSIECEHRNYRDREKIAD
jgi:hypothetical protein